MQSKWVRGMWGDWRISACQRSIDKMYPVCVTGVLRVAQVGVTLQTFSMGSDTLDDGASAADKR